MFQFEGHVVLCNEMLGDPAINFVFCQETVEKNTELNGISLRFVDVCALYRNLTQLQMQFVMQ